MGIVFRTKMVFKYMLLKNTVLEKEYSTFSQHVDKVVSPRSGDFLKLCFGTVEKVGDNKSELCCYRSVSVKKKSQTENVA